MSTSVSAEDTDTTELIIVEYTVDDIKALFDTVDAYAIYDGVKIPTEISPQFGIADGLAFYTCRLQAPAGFATFEFKFPFEATVVSSTVTIMAGNEGYTVVWDTTDDLYPWSLTSEGVYNFSSGFSTQIYTYDYVGTITTSNLYFNVNTYHSDNASILFGIKSLSISYLDSEFNAIVNQLKEQNIKLEGIEKALEESNQRLDDIESSIKDSAQEVIENQDSNTQEIIENQDSNTQEIIDNDKELWDDTFNPTDEEVDNLDVDIHDTVTDIKEKLGLFTFLDDTLTRVLNMFNPYTGDIFHEFPGFTIDINGQTYTIWEPFVVDFRSIFEGFEVLINAVNMGCVVVVYSALINYLYNVFNRIFVKN